MVNCLLRRDLPADQVEPRYLASPGGHGRTGLLQSQRRIDRTTIPGERETEQPTSRDKLRQHIARQVAKLPRWNQVQNLRIADAHARIDPGRVDGAALHFQKTLDLDGTAHPDAADDDDVRAMYAGLRAAAAASP